MRDWSDGYLLYVTGDATDPPRDTPGIIVHVCNDVGAWGKVVVAQLTRRWKSGDSLQDMVSWEESSSPRD